MPIELLQMNIEGIPIRVQVDTPDYRASVDPEENNILVMWVEGHRKELAAKRKDKQFHKALAASLRNKYHLPVKLSIFAFPETNADWEMVK